MTGDDEMASPGGPQFDTHAVLARLRRGDDAAINEAYRIVFGNDLGRLVLADILCQAGVGRAFGSEPTPSLLAYHQGAHDEGCKIRDRAGFDPASVAVLTMTGHLEGRDDEHSAIHSEPDPELPE